MAHNVLLVGRKRAILDNLCDKIEHNNLETKIFKATSLDDVVRHIAHHNIGTVIMGSNIDISDKLEMINTVHLLSDSTTVHMNSHASGPAGMINFANSIVHHLGH